MPEEVNGPVVEVGRYHTYSCNCPDYTKSSGASPHSPWSSGKFSRDWSDSKAGINPLNGDYCWHIFAIIQEMGDPHAIPTDAPPSPEPKIPIKKGSPDGTKSWSSDWAAWP